MENPINPSPGASDSTNSRSASASWLDLVERWFGIITQHAIRRGSFSNVKALVRRIDQFVDHYNAIPPFQYRSQPSRTTFLPTNFPEELKIFTRRSSSCLIASIWVSCFYFLTSNFRGEKATIVLATVESTAAGIDALRRAIAEMEVASRQEPGNISYGFSVPISNPGVLQVVERWESVEALATHLHIPHMTAVNQAIVNHSPKSISARAFEVAREIDIPMPSA